MKKKVLAALLAAAMVVSLTACGGGSDTETTDTAAETTEETTDTTEETTEDAAADETADAAGEIKDLSELKLAFIVGTENDAFYQSVSLHSAKHSEFLSRLWQTSSWTEISVPT